MIVLKTFALFVLTAIAEIVGCYSRRRHAMMLTPPST